MIKLNETTNAMNKSDGSGESENRMTGYQLNHYLKETEEALKEGSLDEDGDESATRERYDSSC